MTEYICKEVQTDNGGYLEPVNELIRCKDCKHRESWLGIDMVCKKFNLVGVEDDDYCSMAERKDEYVTLHHEDIHFNSEEDEKAFYEALAEMKNTRSFTAEEWEFYKKVNREKMQKTGLNIRDFMGEERKE